MILWGTWGPGSLAGGPTGEPTGEPSFGLVSDLIPDLPEDNTILCWYDQSTLHLEMGWEMHFGYLLSG